MKALYLGALIGLAINGAAAGYLFFQQSKGLSEAELETARTLSLGSLQPLRADSSNAVADHPAAISLGEALFHDEGLSSIGQVACATCHLEHRQFQDDLPLQDEK